MCSVYTEYAQRAPPPPPDASLIDRFFADFSSLQKKANGNNILQKK